MDILVKDLKVFASFNEDLYKEITQLLALDNFRSFLAPVNHGLWPVACFLTRLTGVWYHQTRERESGMG